MINGKMPSAITAPGPQADVTEVKLAPELVPLLSAQLYQSPLKAIEELVVNSFDADAHRCYVAITSSTVSVSDDGIGMDVSAFKNLWNVGRSNKRTEDYQKLLKRKQIGKFGIGKLAAFSIATKITYFTKNGADIYSATLDFSQFRTSGGTVVIPIFRMPTTDKAACSTLLGELQTVTGAPQSLFESKSWTVCLLTELGEKAAQISQGRLAYVLRTAMPIVDDFELFLQGSQVKSSKETIPPVVQFDTATFPKERIEELKKRTKTEVSVKDGKIVTFALPSGVSFSASVYAQTISTGKSIDLMRSHGIFVRVRARLVNERDELFGLTPQSYKTWHRFRTTIDADDLDDELTASRESVEESDAVRHVREIALQVFTEARNRYEAWEEKQLQAIQTKREEGRNPVSPRLVEIPIADTISRFGTEHSGAEADSDWFYINFGDAPNKEELLKTLYGPREGVYSYRYEELGLNERLVKFRPAEKLFVLNENHPLVREYKDEDKASQRLPPFSFVG